MFKKLLLIQPVRVEIMSRGKRARECPEVSSRLRFAGFQKKPHIPRDIGEWRTLRVMRCIKWRPPRAGMCVGMAFGPEVVRNLWCRISSRIFLCAAFSARLTQTLLCILFEGGPGFLPDGNKCHLPGRELRDGIYAHVILTLYGHTKNAF